MTGGDETDGDETDGGRSWLALGLGVPAALLFAVVVAALVAVAAVLVSLGPLQSTGDGRAAPRQRDALRHGRSRGGSRLGDSDGRTGAVTVGGGQ